MKLTNTQEIQQAIDEIFARKSSAILERGDFDSLFPAIEDVQGIRAAGQTVAEVLSILEKEIPIDFNPQALFVCYMGQRFRMQDINDLNAVFGQPKRWKKGIAPFESPYGSITVYAFYK